MQNRNLLCIGLGGICEGYLPHVLLLHSTGIVCFQKIRLVDGKAFHAGNEKRQHFRAFRSKAVERCAVWQDLYPAAPLRHLSDYVDAENITRIVKNRSIVLLSPDNHPTRKLVSDHAETLDDILLITGSNDAINEPRGLDGTEGQVIVHWRKNGENLTAPITKHHEEIREPEDARLLTQLSCAELAQSQPQVLATNLLVGHAMVQMLLRYALLPPEEAVQVVEYGINSREGTLVPYDIGERGF